MADWAYRKMSMRKRITIEILQDIAKSHDGKCLSAQYINKKTKMKWECKKGHKFERTADPILYQGSFCPICAVQERGRNKRLSSDELLALCQKKRISFLSTNYSTIYSKLEWSCKKGHIFRASTADIKSRKFPCPECRKTERTAHNKFDSDYFEKYADSKEGIFLGESKSGKLKFQCKFNHQWEVSRNSILSGSWCEKCSYIERGIKKRPEIQQLAKIAEERGGKLLSKEYSRFSKKLRWQCKHEHEWETTGGIILMGSWCPECSTGFRERICRIYFENIFKTSFPKQYPKWLRNDRDNQMELDGYCEELNIAFEHHGEQHYSLKTKYINKESELHQRKRDDVIKEKLCESNGVKLFIIPELFTRTPIEKLKNVIRSEAVRLNVLLPKDFERLEIDHNSAYSVDYHFEKLEEIKQLAVKYGGECLSELYKGRHQKLDFICAEGHQWKASFGDVISGHWCFKCAVNKRAENAKFSRKEIEQFAHDRNGKLLSKKYSSYDEKLKWECASGHIFMSSLHRIQLGRWCPVCNESEKASIRLKEHLKQGQQIALNRNGKLLSMNYENEKKDFKWQCKNGHTWLRPLAPIKNNGTWCPVCARNQPFSIEYLNTFVVKFGGKCLSTEYQNYRTILKWQCFKGHIFEKSFINIKRGSWCPICKGSKVTRRDEH